MSRPSGMNPAADSGEAISVVSRNGAGCNFEAVDCTHATATAVRTEHRIAGHKAIDDRHARAANATTESAVTSRFVPCNCGAENRNLVVAAIQSTAVRARARRAVIDDRAIADQEATPE